MSVIGINTSKLSLFVYEGEAIFEVAVSRVVFTREVAINYFSKTFECSYMG